MNSLTISPVLNQELAIEAAKTDIQYVMEGLDKATADYAAMESALHHLDDALALNKQLTFRTQTVLMGTV